VFFWVESCRWASPPPQVVCQGKAAHLLPDLVSSQVSLHSYAALPVVPMDHCFCLHIELPQQTAASMCLLLLVPIYMNLFTGLEVEQSVNDRSVEELQDRQLR
jgi:hypothetical protein